MRILVTGATGFVGRALIPELINARHEVTVCTRQKLPEFLHLEVKSYLIPDIGPDTDWTGALEDIDTVVHLAGCAHVLNNKANDQKASYSRINTAGTECLAKAAAKPPKAGACKE